MVPFGESPRTICASINATATIKTMSTYTFLHDRTPNVSRVTNLNCPNLNHANLNFYSTAVRRQALGSQEMIDQELGSAGVKLHTGRTSTRFRLPCAAQCSVDQYLLSRDSHWTSKRSCGPDCSCVYLYQSSACNLARTAAQKPTLSQIGERCVASGTAR
jgi:hypothetical protein